MIFSSYDPLHLNTLSSLKVPDSFYINMLRHFLFLSRTTEKSLFFLLINRNQIEAHKKKDKPHYYTPSPSGFQQSFFYFFLRYQSYVLLPSGQKEKRMHTTSPRCDQIAHAARLLSNRSNTLKCLATVFKENPQHYMHCILQQNGSLIILDFMVLCLTSLHNIVVQLSNNIFFFNLCSI